MTATITADTAFDPRPNLAGGIIGSRRTRRLHADLVRNHLAMARTARLFGCRPEAAAFLAAARAERIRFADAVTPAPPIPTGMERPFWSIALGEWIDLNDAA